MMDVAVVGAGAAGLFAAMFAARGGAKVVALDGAARLGAKILIAGGGRCNVTHRQVAATDFNGNRNAIAKVLRTFPVPATIDLFEELGVQLKEEDTGKLFPVTDRARTVLDAILGELDYLGVEIRTNARVLSIMENGDEWLIETSSGTVAARKVILATGGKSVPKTGSDGSGYELARQLGHTVTDVTPALVPLVLREGHWLTELSGTSLDAELSVLARSGRKLATVTGSLLFTHFGLSGPAVLDISRHWIAARRSEECSLIAKLLPNETFETVEETLIDEARRHPRATIASVLRGALPERLVWAIAIELVKGAEGAATPLVRLSRDQRRALVRALVELQLPVERDRGFDYAEVTAGGVPLSEVDLSRMESRQRPRLYLCGEILDVDGRIGGFNFQWAWASGRLAGTSAAIARGE